MSTIYRVSLTQPKLNGTITLEPSKSISNRALIIRSLCRQPFTIHHLSKSDDTSVLEKMLAAENDLLYAGHAGSSYRFMVARATLGEREVTLDASEQLRHRPIGPLVKALQTLGADITYLNKEGFPPLKIKPSTTIGATIHEVTLQAGVSSQYISALLMIAPRLPKGLIINLVGDPVSFPYIHMTLEMMKWFGIPHTWEDKRIIIEPGEYTTRDFTVEGDWSAVAYYYSAAALSENAEITMQGLFENSLQGDAVVSELYRQFGVETIFNETGITIRKTKQPLEVKSINYDFTRFPDLAQTVVVTLSGLGIKGVFTGLQTLRLKETDRIKAMQTELAKVKTILEIKVDDGNLICVLHGKARWKDKAKFDTYDDHRMAMSLVPFACLRPIVIRNPQVVSKSYPGFWKDMASIGIKSEKT
jgi:3-phosphoshikimate 1-carboxyvinyltransferase